MIYAVAGESRTKEKSRHYSDTSVNGSAGRAARASSVAAKAGFKARSLSLRMMGGLEGDGARPLLRQRSAMFSTVGEQPMRKEERSR